LRTKNSVAEKTDARPVQGDSPTPPENTLYSDFHLIDRIAPFLGLGEPPSITDCEDLNLTAYLTAHALAQFIELADRGLAAEGSTLPEDSPLGWIIEALQFELQLGRLTARTLFNLCQTLQRPTQSMTV
jgi:hypothetical protein